MGPDFSLSFSVVLAPAIVDFQEEKTFLVRSSVWSMSWQFPLQLGFEVKRSP